jgi:hypothetical protein
MVITLGMPCNVAKMFSATGASALPGNDQDYVVLNSSSDPEFVHLVNVAVS